MALLLLPAQAGATATLDQGAGWVQVVNDDITYEYNYRETFSVNRPIYKIRGGGFAGDQVGDTIIFYARVEDYFAWDCGWWYVYGGEDSVLVNVTDPEGSVWHVGNMTTSAGTGVLGTANISNQTAANFGGHFGLYYANFSGNNTAAVNFTVFGEPGLNVSVNVSSVNESEPFTLNVTVTDYNGTGITGLQVNATDTRTGETYWLQEIGSGNYSNSTMSITGAGDHIINVIAHNNTAQYTLDGNGVVTISVSKEFYGTELFCLPFFLQICTAIAQFLSTLPVYLMLGFGIVILSRERVFNLLLVIVNRGRRVG